MDGIVYGSAVGFGFALYEDISYGMQFGAETFIARRILGSFGHAVHLVYGHRVRADPLANTTRMKIVSPLLGLLVAIFLHSTFNFLATTLGPVPTSSCSSSCSFTWCSSSSGSTSSGAR